MGTAEVYFYTERFTGYGKTDAEGKYKLYEGAAVGLNTVFFSKLKNDRSSNSTPSPASRLNDPLQVEAAEQAQGRSSRRLPAQLIPREYASESTSDLTYDVPSHGVVDADFFF